MNNGPIIETEQSVLVERLYFNALMSAAIGVDEMNYTYRNKDISIKNLNDKTRADILDEIHDHLI